jgi:hemerythrin
MAFINWEPKYSVNIELIDKQHKTLVDTINQLHEAMKQGKSKEVLGGILDNLINYTKNHFTTEENFFQRFDYKEKVFHTMEHDGFVKKAVEFKKSFDAGNSMISVEVLNFLSNWIKNHILVNDKKYPEFLNSKGIK